jgi:hypothetical protein
MRPFFTSILILSFLVLTPALGAQERVALVIGNSAYKHVPVLVNPKNDANAIASALGRLGFEVIEGTDLTRLQFEAKIREFARAIRGAEIALFYYAGHGLQVNGINYLVPIDTQLLDEADLEFEALRLQTILSQMEREQRTNLIILDACRDNPLTRNLAAKMGTRSNNVGQGLAPTDTGIGTLITYSTQPGNIALDGEGANSPFTEALIQHIETPGEDIGVVMRRVRQDVISKTNGRQVPWDNSSLVGSVILKMGERVAEDKTFDRSQLNKLDPNTAITAFGSLDHSATPIEIENRLGLENKDYKRIQAALNALGYEVGKEDGAFGQKSRNGFIKFQIRNRVEATGYLTEEALQALLKEFNETPKTYDGYWNIEFYRHNYSPADPYDWNGMGVLARARVRLIDEELIIVSSHIPLSVSTRELFTTFSGRLTDDGKITVSMVIDYDGGKAKEKRVTINGVLPQLMPYRKSVEFRGPLLARGSRGPYDKAWAKLVVTRVK